MAGCFWAASWAEDMVADLEEAVSVVVLAAAVEASPAAAPVEVGR